jgi:hypothetical protein
MKSEERRGEGTWGRFGIVKIVQSAAKKNSITMAGTVIQGRERA